MHSGICGRSADSGQIGTIKTHEFLALMILPFLILAFLQTRPTWFFPDSAWQHNSPLVCIAPRLAQTGGVCGPNELAQNWEWQTYRLVNVRIARHFRDKDVPVLACGIAGPSSMKPSPTIPAGVHPRKLGHYPGYG